MSQPTPRSAYSSSPQHHSIPITNTSLPPTQKKKNKIKVTTSSLTPGILSLLRTGAARTPTTIGHECVGPIHAVGSSPHIPFSP